MLEKISDTIEIELMDKGFPTKIDNKRSIKLKELTYNKTTALWGKFLVWQKEQESKTVEVPTEVAPVVPTQEEPKVEMKNPIREKLEEKINILERNLYEGKIQVGYRAIKLKEKMITNLHLHTGMIYSEKLVVEEKEMPVETKTEETFEQAITPEVEIETNVEIKEEVKQPEPVVVPEVEEIKTVEENAPEEVKVEIPSPIKENDIIIAPDRENILEKQEIEVPAVEEENIEEETNELDSIKISKNSQRAAKMDFELPETDFVDKEIIQEAIQEEISAVPDMELEEFPEPEIFMPKIEIPRIKLSDILIKYDETEETEEVEEYDEEPMYVNFETTDYVSNDNQLEFEEQEEIISALNKMEENIRLHDTNPVTSEYIVPEIPQYEQQEEKYEEVSEVVEEDNSDINFLLEQLHQLKEQKNKAEKELEQTYAEIENSEHEKAMAKERLSKAIESLKEDCAQEARKAEENRDKIKSNAATINAILNAIEMTK